MIRKDLGALAKHQHIVRSGIEVVDFIPKMTNFGDGSDGDASQAVAFVNNNEIGGHSDWVLPCRATLLALCDTQLFLDTCTYWSCSHDYYCNGFRWSVLFFAGDILQNRCSRLLKVRLVRESQQMQILMAAIRAMRNSSDIKPLYPEPVSL